jgi:hypothetical protein
MRRVTTGITACLLVACSDASTTPQGDPGVPEGTGGSSVSSSSSGASGGSAPDPGDPLDFPNDDFSNEDSTGDDLLDPLITAPTQLTADDGVLIAITADDRVVYRRADGVFSIKAAQGGVPRKAASVPGDVHVHGRTIFNFANIDYASGQGDLTFWTPAVGRRSVGRAMIGAGNLAARSDAAHVIFTRVYGDTLTLVISSADTEQAQVLVAGAGRGSDTTCAPSFGFAGAAAVVSWCMTGSINATLARFTVTPQGVWQREDVSDTARGLWSSDAAGANLFYVTAEGEGWVTDMSTAQKVSEGVGWGLLHPTGDPVFFTVGDQLRRRNAGSTPIPIVVDGFTAAVAWNADMTQVLYSSVVDYQEGMKQDLRTTSTDWFNPSPTLLVTQPVATIGRSALTSDGQRALYFTNLGTQGGTLNVRPLSGAPAVTLPLVDTVLTAAGSVIVFTDNRSEPTEFPILADMRRLDTALPGGPQLIEAGILDGRDIQLRSDELTVAYARPGKTGEGGIWLRPVLPVP